MRHTKTLRALRSAALSLAGSATVLLLASVSYRSQLHVLPAVGLCLLVVVLVSLSGHFVPAVVSSIVALLCLNYFFFTPSLPLRVFQAYGGHWGLLGMRERASQVRGKLSLHSTPGHGTKVVLLVPYAVSDHSASASLAPRSTS